MARNLHSGIRWPAEDDPTDIRAPNPGAVKSVSRLRGFLSFWRRRERRKKDVKAVRE